MVVEPSAGLSPIHALLAGAHRSLDLTMYELVDPVSERLLATDAARGVRVRVLLDRTDEERRNAAAFSYLAAHAVAVRWASDRYTRTHEKAAVIDGTTALVMTLNLVTADYAGTRDFALADHLPVDVSAIESVFSADWQGAATPTPTGSDLVWSPGAEAPLVALIDGARRQLLVENEEMDDPYITRPLEQAARRGVDVEIVMTEDSEWATAFDALAAAGAHVRTYAESAPLYIHAKAIVADPGGAGARAFVGSQNFSIASLVYNRELGVETSSGAVVAPLAGALAADFAGARPWAVSPR